MLLPHLNLRLLSCTYRPLSTKLCRREFRPGSQTNQPTGNGEIILPGNDHMEKMIQFCFVSHNVSHGRQAHACIHAFMSIPHKVNVHKLLLLNNLGRDTAPGSRNNAARGALYSPSSVSCHTMPSRLTLVPGSQGPKHSGSVARATSEVFTATDRVRTIICSHGEAISLLPTVARRWRGGGAGVETGDSICEGRSGGGGEERERERGGGNT